MWKIEVETIEDPLARGSLWSASNTNLMILIPHLRFTWIGRFKNFLYFIISSPPLISGTVEVPNKTWKR